jgi:predicted transcriptional regulator
MYKERAVVADEPEKTPIQSVYAQRFAEDLLAIRKEQADLQERLEQLRVEEEFLVKAQGILPAAVIQSGSEAEPAVGADEASLAAKGEQRASEAAAPASAEAVADAARTVPKPRQDKQAKAAQSKPAPKKAAAPKGKSTATKTASAKTTVKKTAATKAPATKAQATEAPAKEKAVPPLHELVLGILRKSPGEPCVAREISEQLAQDHPERATSVQTVRNALEALVKKKVVEKSNQQGSAMYTAYGAPAAGDAIEEAPAKVAEKVSAEV